MKPAYIQLKETRESDSLKMVYDMQDEFIAAVNAATKYLQTDNIDASIVYDQDNFRIIITFTRK